jgi:ribonuclease III
MNTERDSMPPAGLEAALGVRFADPRLLLTAMTHRSYLNEAEQPDTEDNERLEFLGDALVDFIAADYLYRVLPASREGELTTLRSALVCEPKLAEFARRLDLGAYLRLGRGEAASGGRQRPAILCDGFEALVGALYLDQGFAIAETAVMGFFRPEVDALVARRGVKDAKSLFQELAQRVWQITPEYRTIAEHGPDHDKSFEVTVYLGDDAWGSGEGRSKADAARHAALRAVERLHAERPDVTLVR